MPSGRGKAMELKGRRVLVTGADGFIGSHLAEALVAEGAKVRALAQYNSFNSWGWLEDAQCLPSIEVVTGDIRDPHFMHAAMQDCEAVFHLAALIAIPYSYAAPSSYVDTNITGTLNVMQAARDLGVKRVVHTSTSEVYGTARYVPIDEKHPLQPQSPYSATKIAADALASSFHHAYGLPVTIVRPFNTYGPRQSARAVIPTVITQLAAGERSLKLGNLAPTRDFNYVSDTCRGFIQLAQCDAAVGKTVNVGSSEEVSIGDTVAMIGEIMGVKFEIVTDAQRVRPASSEVERLCCDNSLIRSLTGFAPQVPIREGLAKTVAWFSEAGHLNRYKADLYNV
jgi:NAD dependent epimerase/dehydratase